MLDAMEKEACGSDANPEQRRKTFTGTCFVVLKTEKDMLKCVNMQKTGLLFWFYKTFFWCFLPKDALWQFRRAPEPTDINWENMQYANGSIN